MKVTMFFKKLSSSESASQCFSWFHIQDSNQ